MAARPPARTARGPRRGGRAAHVAVHRERTPAHPAAARLRPWNAAPPSVRAALRRRAHGVVSLFLGAGSSCCQALQALSPGHRLARGLDARLLGRVPRPARADWMGGPEAVRARGAPRLLLLAAARGAAPSRGLPRRA